MTGAAGPPAPWSATSRAVAAWRASRLRAGIRRGARVLRTAWSGSAVLGGRRRTAAARGSVLAQAAVGLLGRLWRTLAGPGDGDVDTAAGPRSDGADVRAAALLTTAAGVGLVPAVLLSALPDAWALAGAGLALFGLALLTAPPGADVAGHSRAVRLFSGR